MSARLQPDQISGGWAYPSSPHAVKMGRAKEGCWHLDFQLAGRKLRSEGPFDTIEEMEQAGELTGLPWSALYLRYSPRGSRFPRPVVAA